MTEETLQPIPLDFIVSHAQAQSTEARRRPFAELAKRWADHEGASELASPYIARMMGRQTISAEHMPKEFTPRFRQAETAARLLEIVRQIDQKISSGEENWTWAHVMRVMMDEGILFPNRMTPNLFDSIICSIVEGKGRDTVRKNGDYALLLGAKDSWAFWPKDSYLNPQMAAHRTVCMMIAKELEPVLTRKIRIEY